jgi:GTP-binding protein HflX
LNLQGNGHEDLNEFRELVLSAGAQSVAEVTGSRQIPEAKYFVGSGKANEIKSCVETYQAEIVLFNHTLTPSQERNLETLLKCRVLDRTGLILDIFAQRARTFEGKLQVELAQLQHISTRLVRGWMHLERQKGGIGLRGPGETQLETDRRLIRGRIKYIKKRLEKVRSQRSQSRRARQKAEIPTVSIVGYTNAGKSTLFNSLTSATVYTADQLFATLDPTLRNLALPHAGKIILADTVGFIRQLPHGLIDAFRATLEETLQADLLLHIIDAYHNDYRSLIHEVNAVLEEIGAAHIPQLFVYNKVDLLEDVAPRIDRNEAGHPESVWVSALTGQGIDLLVSALAEWIGRDLVTQTLCLTLQQGKLRAAFYEKGVIVSEQEEPQGGWIITVRMPRRDFEKMMHQ